MPAKNPFLAVVAQNSRERQGAEGVLVIPDSVPGQAWGQKRDQLKGSEGAATSPTTDHSFKWVNEITATESQQNLLNPNKVH